MGYTQYGYTHSYATKGDWSNERRKTLFTFRLLDCGVKWALFFLCLNADFKKQTLIWSWIRSLERRFQMLLGNKDTSTDIYKTWRYCQSVTDQTWQLIHIKQHQTEHAHAWVPFGLWFLYLWWFLGNMMTPWYAVQHETWKRAHSAVLQSLTQPYSVLFFLVDHC